MGFEMDTSSMTQVREFVGQIMSSLFDKGLPFFWTSEIFPGLTQNLEELIDPSVAVKYVNFTIL